MVPFLSVSAIDRSAETPVRDVGDDALNLTGPRAVPLGEATRAHIEALPGARKPEAFLFPRHAKGRGAYRLESCWRAVCDAELGRLRLHDLRHYIDGPTMSRSSVWSRFYRQARVAIAT